MRCLPAPYLRVLCNCMFSVPNTPSISPRRDIDLPQTFQMCWSLTQLVCSESIFVTYKANLILCYVCTKKGEKELISPYLYYSLLTQATVFLTSSSPISNEEWTAYKLSTSNLFAGDLVVPQGPSLVLPDSRVAENWAFPLTKLFILATLSLLSEWLKKTL